LIPFNNISIAIAPADEAGVIAVSRAQFLRCVLIQPTQQQHKRCFGVDEISNALSEHRARRICSEEGPLQRQFRAFCLWQSKNRSPGVKHGQGSKMGALPSRKPAEDGQPGGAAVVYRPPPRHGQVSGARFIAMALALLSPDPTIRPYCT